MVFVVNPITFIAGADLSDSQFQAVKVSADDTIVDATAGSQNVGILQNDPVSGKEASVAIVGSTSYAYAGAAVAINDRVMSDANGQLIPVTANLDEYLGHAITIAAAQDDRFEMIICPGTLSSA